MSRLLAVMAVIISLDITCLAQEIGFIDVTKVKARTETRSPAQAQRPDGALSGIERMEACFTPNTEGTIRTTLLSLNRSHFRRDDQATFEVAIENSGSVPVKIPFSPHLADLQPADPGKKFVYSQLSVILWIGGDRWSANTGGTVALYGADDHPNTVVTLNPGESVRLIGRGYISVPSTDISVFAELIRKGDAIDHANAEVKLYTTESLMSAVGAARIRRQVCFDQKQGRNVSIEVTE